MVRRKINLIYLMPNKQFILVTCFRNLSARSTTSIQTWKKKNIIRYNILKKKQTKKQVLLKKFPRPSIVTSLWNYFHIAKIAQFLDENVSSPNFFRVTSIFIRSNPTFLFVARLYLCLRSQPANLPARINLTRFLFRLTRLFQL